MEELREGAEEETLLTPQDKEGLSNGGQGSVTAEQEQTVGGGLTSMTQQDGQTDRKVDREAEDGGREEEKYEEEEDDGVEEKGDGRNGIIREEERERDGGSGEEEEDNGKQEGEVKVEIVYYSVHGEKNRRNYKERDDSPEQEGVTEWRRRERRDDGGVREEDRSDDERSELSTEGEEETWSMEAYPDVSSQSERERSYMQ